MKYKELLEGLKSSEEFVRVEACHRLGEAGAQEAAKALMGVFSDESWLVREAAVDALVNLWGDKGGAMILASLRDRDARVRSSAIEILTSLGDRGMDAVIDALNDEDENVKRYAAGILGDIGSVRAVPYLIKRLGSTSEDVCYDIILALGKIKDATATRHVLEYLDEGLWLQSAAVEALGKIEDPRAVAKLLLLLKTDTFLKAQIAETLGRIGDPKALPALFSCFEEGDVELNDAVLMAIVAIKDKAHGEMHVQDGYRLNAELVVSAALAAFEKRDSVLKRAAAIILGWLKAESAIPSLADSLSDEDEDVSKTAREALIEIGEAAVPSLLTLMSIPVKRARLMAIRTLGEIGDDRAGAIAVEKLVDEDEDIRRAAALVTGKLVPAEGVEPLLGLLKDASDKVRAAAISAISSYPEDEELYARLKRMLASEEVLERRSAAEVFGRVAYDGVVTELEHLLGDADPGVKQAAVFALVKLKHLKVGSLPVMFLGSEDPVVRKAGVIALGELKDKRAVQPLSVVIEDEDIWVRYHTALALGNIGDTRAVEPLLKCLNDPVGAVRLATVRALGALGDESCMDSLVSLVDDEDEDVRMALAEALGCFNSQGSSGTLMRLLTDASWQVREAAVFSIAKILPAAQLRSALSPLLSDPNRFVSDAAREVLSDG